jgi:ubiquinone/menaquinone biosynthesis C-methylase UbiE
MSTPKADERLRDEFNDWARAGKGESMEKGHRPIGEQAIKSMQLPANARVLDVGCGSGWAARLMAEEVTSGRVVGIDISDEMVRLAQESSQEFKNVEFQVASAEKLPFADGEFTHAFSMESLYYYANIPVALKEIARVLERGGRFTCVVDLYEESKATHQWIKQLKVPVQLLSSSQYISLFEAAGFQNVRAGRIFDPRPVPDDYSGGSFETREDLADYRQMGSLVVTGEV